MAATPAAPKLAIRQLGKTGLRVSELCFGAMTLGDSTFMKLPTESDEAKCFALMDQFVAAGGNFFDTADVYGRGSSEETLGKWLAGKNRDDFVIATKVRGPMGPGPNDSGLSRKHIMQGVEASLKRLGTSYIDLYQVHFWDQNTPLEETLSTLNDLVRSGKVRYLGASNYCGWQLQKAIDMAKNNGWEPFTVLQPQYNLLCRPTEWELLDLCATEGLGVLPWSPLLGGWLSGRFTKEKYQEQLAGSRVQWAETVGWQETNFSRLNNDHTWHLLDIIREVATEAGKTMSQVSLNWLLQKPAVTSPIIGVRTPEQLTDNLGASGWAQMDRLDAASAVDVPYPWRLIASQRARKV